MTLKRQFDQQQFSNGYELVNGVAMHTENGNRLHQDDEIVFHEN
jgi:hypothetical protein